MLHPITLGQIRDAHPCSGGWEKLLKARGFSGGKFDPAHVVTLGDVAQSNGAQDALWCSRCLPPEARRDVIRAILPSVKRAGKSSKQSDGRVTDCAIAIQRWIGGDNSIDLVAAAAAAAWAAADAAWAAADAAAWAAADAAAWAADAAANAAANAAADAAAWAADAAWAAANAAANAAAWAAADAAWAVDAERAEQVRDIVFVFGLTEKADAQ